jgi:hypothetical protein
VRKELIPKKIKPEITVITTHVLRKHEGDIKVFFLMPLEGQKNYQSADDVETYIFVHFHPVAPYKQMPHG